ncbi:MAG TPA: HD domain-containing protein [Acidobacteriota bacterium]
MPGRKFKEATQKARGLIVRAERRFSGRPAGQSDSFLWEHSEHVAALCRRLAKEEGEDSDLAYLTGLFHDAGKFVGGQYHSDEQPEELAASAAASKILDQTGFSRRSINRLTKALKSLYQPKAGPDTLADIVHDADFLSKFGRLGVAQFFIKSALRGRSLERAITEYSSKELTYAALLPRNMRTRAGRRLAGKKAAETLRYFEGLLREIKDMPGAPYRVKLFKVSRPGDSGRAVPVRLVLAASCRRCGGRWVPEFSTETGIKCEKLEAALRCSGCGQSYRISFCLPEIQASDETRASSVHMKRRFGRRGQLARRAFPSSDHS